MLIPAFIFFFQMLYPFAWANDRGARDRGGGRRLHAGATRCTGAAGGLAAIRNALIDDCALARLMKRIGPSASALTAARDQHPPLPGHWPMSAA